jgi:transposase
MDEQQHSQSKRPRARREFTTEFKCDAVELVRTTGRPIAQIARELGIYDSILGNWVRQDAIDRGEREGLPTEEQTRLRQLEAENTRLRMGWFASLKVELVDRRHGAPAPRSSPGSTTTTNSGCTRPTAIWRRSSRSNNTPPSAR